MTRLDTHGQAGFGQGQIEAGTPCCVKFDLLENGYVGRGFPRPTKCFSTHIGSTPPRETALYLQFGVMPRLPRCGGCDVNSDFHPGAVRVLV
jgi:hypothetical protein